MKPSGDSDVLGGMRMLPVVMFAALAGGTPAQKPVAPSFEMSLRAPAAPIYEGEGLTLELSRSKVRNWAKKDGWSMPEQPIEWQQRTGEQGEWKELKVSVGGRSCPTPMWCGPADRDICMAQRMPDSVIYQLEPGSYRARVRYLSDGELRFTKWCEFAIEPHAANRRVMHELRKMPMLDALTAPWALVIRGQALPTVHKVLDPDGRHAKRKQGLPAKLAEMKKKGISKRLEVRADIVLLQTWLPQHSYDWFAGPAAKRALALIDKHLAALEPDDGALGDVYGDLLGWKFRIIGKCYPKQLPALKAGIRKRYPELEAQLSKPYLTTRVQGG